MVLSGCCVSTLITSTVCLLTTDTTDVPAVRLTVKPSEGNGLRTVSRLMVDKISTMAKTKLGTYVGRLADEDIVRLNRAALVFLGLAGSTQGSMAVLKS